MQGDPGTGKTTMALQFLRDGRARGERGLYVTLLETTAELHAIAASLRSASGLKGGIPAIALSAYTRVEDRDAAYAAGFTDFVGKPAAPQDLLYAVQRVLN